jgi:uncharacterized protein
MKKKTVVLGASDNPSRYSYKAVQMLTQYQHPVVAVGLKEGSINNVPIHADYPQEKEVDTVTMYVGARNQAGYYDYILSLHPKRIIFNPGAENEELEQMAKQKGIEVVHGCTLVMLSIGHY